MKITSLILAAIVLTLSIYTLVTDNYFVMPYFELFVSFMFVVLGLLQLRENHKVFGIFLLVCAGFALYASIVGFV
ncbi:hypothetical protein NCCP2716_26970 [Sporosarcina sp. NCCP-2716]|uniref:DUF3953 domain-containing protein n=1 Tax=Sporosarcina sp. NCCP-2716 TaxID=2943679 RepID=UPI00208739F3|nr:hypothetical protein NCCP2716_26970 [Sporosarcina sp. NCCP-2716]